jgi:hypothetical protein
MSGCSADTQDAAGILIGDQSPVGSVELPHEPTDDTFFTSGTSYQPC